MKKNFVKKLLCTLYFISLTCMNVSGQQKRYVGQEASLFLTLQNIKLGTLSTQEEKRNYLYTIYATKQAIQRRML
ncbi:MAG TPA: hypothetical protein VMW66_04730, partial [Elusimicrobiales bacterium]|nr:hypothetical protein [Elusimicrobiales bacterium]